ncbi:hypothetical protein FZEAL_5423 [Fusarium zealandicum]|uniref:Calcineurin-like phosphoesterase domain-containing protein n=1 Tax=Fusarium zealandicum TaxID=1053134 RepID=A0A8H4UJY0_9HYPO|nr:hypothetical protein FZEAL_5423 [Fusarium zealandicum]
MLSSIILVPALVGLSHQVASLRARDNADLDPLRFSTEGSFQICIFSDLHFAEDASGIGPEQDRKSAAVMGDVLDFDRPDLVVLNGDLINGESTYRENSTHYIDQIVAPMVDRNLTWASTYGNHDHNKNIRGEDILEREQSWPGSRTDNMVSSTDAGVTNYYLPVYASNCESTEDCTPELLLWFFDSRGGFYYQGSAQPNWVDTSVVEWFNETYAALTEEHGKEIPSVAFVHIPIHASYEIQKDGDIDSNKNPGINGETVIQQSQGWCSEDNDGGSCSYGGQDMPFMRSLVSKPAMIGLFYGHDHANSWCYKWDTQVSDMEIAGSGINLCYGQHTGYGGYGDWIRGGRQLVFTQEGLKDNAFDTHILLESGEVVGSISLNSTFNSDSYESTPNQKSYLSDASSSLPSSICGGRQTICLA